MQIYYVEQTHLANDAQTNNKIQIEPVEKGCC